MLKLQEMLCLLFCTFCARTSAFWPGRCLSIGSQQNTLLSDGKWKQESGCTRVLPGTHFGSFLSLEWYDGWWWVIESCFPLFPICCSDFGGREKLRDLKTSLKTRMKWDMILTENEQRSNFPCNLTADTFQCEPLDVQIPTLSVQLRIGLRCTNFRFRWLHPWSLHLISAVVKIISKYHRPDYGNNTFPSDPANITTLGLHSTICGLGKLTCKQNGQSSLNYLNE